MDFESAISAALGLVLEPDPAHGQYTGWLAIPYLTPTGVVYMNFRCLQEFDRLPPDAERVGDIIKTQFPEQVIVHDHEAHGGKYQGPTGDKKHLYNVPALHLPGGTIGITEGELDAVVASSSGLPAVGVPGATNWKPFWRRLFEDYERVLILGDGDKAGRQFANKVAGLLHNGVARPMPEGHDVSSYVLEYGTSSFLEYVQL